MPEQPAVKIDRLFAAADALLRALGAEDKAAVAHVECEADESRPLSSMHGRLFTHHELSEAMAMLIRMGLVEGRKIVR